MPGMAAPDFPAVALVLALFMLGYLLWATDRLAARARARRAPAVLPRPQLVPLAAVPASAASPIDAPADAEAGPAHRPAGHRLLAVPLAEGCKIVMSIAMGYMLITML